MPKTKKSTKSTKSYPEGPAGSYLPGLPASVVADQARTMKASAGGPRYKILKDGSGISTVTKTPLNQKAVVEKGSYEKGKVEKYASKGEIKKHEKKETKKFEKKEMKKSPLKQVKPSPKSKLTDFEKQIETAAKTDSIEASKPKNMYLYTKKEREDLGNKAANKTRAINKSSVTVEKKEVKNPKTGYYNSYAMKAVEPKKTPLKQVSALSGKKDKSTVAPKTVAAGIARRSPILMKKKC